MKQTAKKTYEKPAIVHRQILESIAGACPVADPTNGKTGGDGACVVVNS